MDTRPGSRELAALTAEFYIPPPSVLNASGYAGSHGSLPEVVADAPDVLRKVGMGSQARIHAFKHSCPYNTIQYNTKFVKCHVAVASEALANRTVILRTEA